MLRRALTLLTLLLALVSTTAHAQSPSVSQSGPVVPGHIVCFTGGYPQQVYDCGPGGGALGIGQTSVLGAQSGSILYDNNNALGALTQAQFGALFCINTSGIVIPVSSGGCTPPGGSLPGGLVSGPGSSISGDIPTFNGTTGTALQDSGVPIGNVVQGPSSVVTGDLATFNGTSGKSIQDSGVTTASLTPSVLTIAALRLSNNHTLPNSTVWVQGYSSAVDGGEGQFTYISTDVTSADNSGTIIVDGSGRRWYRNGLGSPLKASWFGCNSTSSDCTAAFLNAYNTLITAAKGGGEIDFGKGTRTFLSPITLTYPTGAFSLNLVGEGSDATVLNWPNTAGLTIAASLAQHIIHMRDLSFTTGSANVAPGLTLNNSFQGGAFLQSDLYRVTFRGFDGPALTDSWSTAISVNGMSNIVFDTVTIYGNSANSSNGINLQGVPSGSFKYGLQYNLSKCALFNLGSGLIYNTYVQGVQVDQTNFDNVTTGILVPTGAQNGAQLVVANSQFLVSGNGIVVLSQFGDLILIGNTIYAPANGTAVLLNGPGSLQTTIVGNDFSYTPPSNAGSTGVDVLATNAGVITGNTFAGLNVGVNLSGSPTGWNVQANSYISVNAQVTNPGSNSVGVATK